jgi:peroxiredoxin
MMALLLETILPWLLLAALGMWLAYHLVCQNGRILTRLDALEKRLLAGAPPPNPVPGMGLPEGTPAPEFELPDTLGGRTKLSQFRGRRVLLVFFNPSCGHCTKMVQSLAELPLENGHPVPLVVSTGDPETNRMLFQQHGARGPVLLQEGSEIAAQYLTRGTPTGYLVDESGTISSPLARGADALFGLLDPNSAAARPAPKKSGCGCGKSANAHGNKDLEHSRIERTGLKPGNPAPDFRLPKVGGGELRFDDYRGKRVLLVFSDPECSPCDELAPRLELLHRDRPDLRVIMVGRRDPELNRQKAAKFGLTFPIALQKNWEVSLLYGMFATPVGFLIDESGVVIAGVAKGVQPILDLASTAGVPAENLPRQSADRGREVAVH